MANKKISALDAVTTLAVSDTMVVVQGGVTKKSSIQKLVDLIPEGQIESGASAYDVAVSNGFVGDEAAWLASLKGDPGVDGDNIVPTPAATDADRTIYANADGTYRVHKIHNVPEGTTGLGLTCPTISSNSIQAILEDAALISVGLYKITGTEIYGYWDGTTFSRYKHRGTVSSDTGIIDGIYYTSTGFTGGSGEMVPENTTFVINNYIGIFYVFTGQVFTELAIEPQASGYFRLTYINPDDGTPVDEIRLLLNGQWNTFRHYGVCWLIDCCGYDVNKTYNAITNPQYILGSNGEDEVRLLDHWFNVVCLPDEGLFKPVKINHVFGGITMVKNGGLNGFIEKIDCRDFADITTTYDGYAVLKQHGAWILVNALNEDLKNTVIDSNVPHMLSNRWSGGSDWDNNYPALSRFTLTEAQYLKVASDSPSILNWYTGAADPSIAPLDAPDGAIYLRSDGWVWSKSGGTWTQSAVQLIIPPSHPPTGEMYDDGTSTTVSMATAETYYPITSGFSTGLCNGVTFDSNQLLCLTAGNYFVSWNLTASHSIGDITIGGVVTVNNTEKPQTESVARAKDSGVPYALSGSGIITLAVDDVVKLAVERETGAGTTTLTINHANITMFRIG